MSEKRAKQAILSKSLLFNQFEIKPRYRLLALIKLFLVV